MRVIAIVQARMGSSRLPGKVMAPIGDHTLIEILLTRLAGSRLLDQIVVAASDSDKDIPLIKHVTDLGWSTFVGREQDVLDRFYNAAVYFRGDLIVRITGDCPLISPVLVDEIISQFIESKVEYGSNIEPPTFPDGLDVEVFTFAALADAVNNAKSKFDREHVTPFIRKKYSLNSINVPYEKDLSKLRWTVDESTDLEVVRRIFDRFHPDIDFSWERVLELQLKEPSLFAANKDISRNEGSSMTEGQKLWKRAKHVIPGGTMLLSKRPELFLPGKWPTYFKSAKGCHVQDLDGNTFTDMSIMGIGTNILGYGHEGVDAAVKDVVLHGNMSTLNCAEEVWLAEKLVEMHPWSDMVRFARTGGEANAIAVRIARAASGRDGVAVCGYHGWHDWYLAVNLKDGSGLDGHLLPGLEPNGVPKDLAGSVHPFEYGDFEALSDLVRRENIGTIKMEVSRSTSPDVSFLKRVRELANQNNIVLIFDECTSGFRQCFGGIHLLTNVDPDIAMFGKALGNGYAVTAVVGRREVMEAAQSSFISSTFWTERVGSAAALKTLEVMSECGSWDIITSTGNDIRGRWQSLADEHGLAITHNGLPSLTGFVFDSPNHLAYKTIISQEMLKKGFLAGTSVYVSTAHTEEIIERYFAELSEVFGLIRLCEDGRDVSSVLEGPICHSGFKRLN